MPRSCSQFSQMGSGLETSRNHDLSYHTCTCYLRLTNYLTVEQTLKWQPIECVIRHYSPLTLSAKRVYTHTHTHTHTHTPLTTTPGTTPQSPTSPQSHQQPSSRPRPVARKRIPTDSDLESSTSSSSPLTSINSTHALSQRQGSTCDSIAEELDIYTDDNGAEADTFAQPVREEEEKLKMEVVRMKREKESLQVQAPS